MPDPHESGTRRAPVDAWETTITGLDRDPWLRRFVRSSRVHESPDDALAFYSRIFLEAPVALVILTRDNLVADANVAAQQLLKRSLEQLRGRPLIRSVTKGNRSAFLDIAHDIAEDTRRSLRPLRLVDPKGIEIDIKMIGSSLRNEDGEVEFVMLVFFESDDDDVPSDIL